MERGFTKKQQLIDWLAANAVMRAREHCDDPCGADADRAARGDRRGALGVDVAAPPEQPVRKYRTQHISVVVLGGETHAAWKRVDGNFARAKTVRVEDWR